MPSQSINCFIYSNYKPSGGRICTPDDSIILEVAFCMRNVAVITVGSYCRFECALKSKEFTFPRF